MIKSNSIADLTINETGIEQCKTTGIYINKQYGSFDHIYSSNLKRAQETTKIISSFLEILSFPPITILDILREKDYYNESLESFNKRILDTIDLLKSSQYDKFIIVSHSTFIKHLFAQLFHTKSELFSINNCSITCVIYDNITDTFEMKFQPMIDHLQ